MHNTGKLTEYLASDPVDVPGLNEVLRVYTSEDGSASNVVFTTPREDLSRSGPCSRLSSELCQMLMEYLSRAEVASMRFVSKKLKWLKDLKYEKLWKELFAKESQDVEKWDWKTSHFSEKCELQSASGKELADAEIKAGYEVGMWPRRNHEVLLGLRNRRRIWQYIEKIVRRIGALPPDEMD
ncbi:hypothetical protein LTR08_007511 [Meristemomyces frigidus]|nr:hypothetical protein LTR08_007511 [Meristemomyces frigidus]